MKKTYLFLLFICLTQLIKSQEVDYVIDDPGKREVKKYIQPSIIDSIRIANPDYTSYFLNATSYTLDKKKIRLSGTDVIFIKGSYGISDNLMASVNISLLGTFTGSLKQQIKLTDQIKVAISVSGGRLFFEDYDFSRIDSITYMGGGQAMLTLGDRQNNITVGTGLYYIKSTYDFWGNGEDNFLLNNVYLGLQKQIGKKFYLMAEATYFLDLQVFTGAIGIKAVIGDRVSLNAGVMPFGYNDPSLNKIIVEQIPIPLLSFRYLLGKNR